MYCSVGERFFFLGKEILFVIGGRGLEKKNLGFLFAAAVGGF